MASALPPLAVLVMGVAGCGKSSLAAALAQALGAVLVEGDDFHPAANRAKLRAGVALDDSDRASWLQALCAQLRHHADGRVVLTCSALRRRYREQLRAALAAGPAGPAASAASAVAAVAAVSAEASLSGASGASALRVVFIDIEATAAAQRVQERAARDPAHAFHPALLPSQFAALESPLGEPGVLRVDAAWPCARQVAVICAAWGLEPA